MKRSKIEQIVAEMQAELAIVERCIASLKASESGAEDTLHQQSHMLSFAIARLSGNGTEAPKPARTRKSRKATEPTL